MPRTTRAKIPSPSWSSSTRSRAAGARRWRSPARSRSRPSSPACSSATTLLDGVLPPGGGRRRRRRSGDLRGHLRLLPRQLPRPSPPATSSPSRRRRGVLRHEPDRHGVRLGHGRHRELRQPASDGGHGRACRRLAARSTRATFENIEGMLVDVHRHAGRQRVLPAGPLRPDRADRVVAAVPVHPPRCTPSVAGLRRLPRRPGDASDHPRRRQQRQQRRHLRRGRRRGVLLPGGWSVARQQVPRRRHHRRPDRRDALELRRVVGHRCLAHPADPDGVRLHLHVGQPRARPRPTPSAGRSRWRASTCSTTSRRSTRPRAAAVVPAGRAARSTAAAPTASPSSTASETRSSPR